MSTYCGEYCTGICKDCVNFNWRNSICSPNGLVKETDSCRAFHCKLTGLDEDGIRELIIKQKEEGYYDR